MLPPSLPDMSSSSVVQQRGLFNDPVAEINSLVHVIKQEMQDLNAELDASQVRNGACGLPPGHFLSNSTRRYLPRKIHVQNRLEMVNVQQK